MDRLQKWEHATEWPLTGTAVVFLAAYAVPIAAPDAPPWLLGTCDWLVWITWALFVVDYVMRFALSSRRWTFVKAHLLDLAVVALPLLRPLRLIRLLALLSILNRTATKELRGRVITYTAGAAILLLVVGSLAITDAERGEPGANIETLGDGIWWALTTVTTVGYGDHYPVTITGRFVATALMIGGIAILGMVTATIASWLVERVTEVTENEEAATRVQVDRLAEELAALRAELQAGRSVAPEAGATDA